MSTLSFMSDDGLIVELGMEIFVQAKDCGYYKKHIANEQLIHRRLGLVKEKEAWLYEAQIPIHWNYFVKEENAIEHKANIEANGPDKITFLPKTII